MREFLARRYVGEDKAGAQDPDQKGIGAPIYRIIKAQLIAVIVLFAACFYVDWVKAYSILLGGMVCVVPAAFAAWRISRKTAKPAAAMIHVTMAEAGKLLLTVALFVAVFVMVKPLNVIFFFGSIITLHSFYILMPIIDLRKREVQIGE